MWDKKQEKIIHKISPEIIDLLYGRGAIQSLNKEFLGGGKYGLAYKVGDLVVKITTDDAEALTAFKLIQIKHPNIYNIYNVF